jgi:hypothetical protein
MGKKLDPKTRVLFKKTDHGPKGGWNKNDLGSVVRYLYETDGGHHIHSVQLDGGGPEVWAGHNRDFDVLIPERVRGLDSLLARGGNPLNGVAALPIGIMTHVTPGVESVGEQPPTEGTANTNAPTPDGLGRTSSSPTERQSTTAGTDVAQELSERPEERGERLIVGLVVILAAAGAGCTAYCLGLSVPGSSYLGISATIVGLFYLLGTSRASGFELSWSSHLEGRDPVPAPTTPSQRSST